MVIGGLHFAMDGVIRNYARQHGSRRKTFCFQSLLAREYSCLTAHHRLTARRWALRDTKFGRTALSGLYDDLDIVS